MPVARHFVACRRPIVVETSRAKTRHFLRCRRIYKVHPNNRRWMEGFAVTCPLVPDASRLISGFCSSPRSLGLGFLQTPPRDDALALLLAFGSAKNLATGLA
ncbi:hypothetical protein GGI1_04202, partial [Acidithiobacillus sp. GGI-221]